MIDNALNHFDPALLIDQLIQEMGLTQESPEKVAQLKENLALSLHHCIFQAAAQALETDIIEAALEEYKDEKNLSQFYLKLLQMSPTAQKAIQEAIQTFGDETLAAYEILSNRDEM